MSDPRKTTIRALEWDSHHKRGTFQAKTVEEAASKLRNFLKDTPAPPGKEIIQIIVTVQYQKGDFNA